MATAKVMTSGDDQAIALPRTIRFASEEVEIFRRGDEVVIRERPATLAHAFDLIAELPDELSERDDPPPQARKLE